MVAERPVSFATRRRDSRRPVNAPPEEFNADVQSEVKRWSKIINDNNVRPE